MTPKQKEQLIHRSIGEQTYHKKLSVKSLGNYAMSHHNSPQPQPMLTFAAKQQAN